MVANEPQSDEHTKIILERYADRGNIGVLHTPPEQIVNRYLKKVMEPEELEGKTILEIGAGCSQLIPVFMKYGCKRYYANDLIPERLAKTRVDDPRYVELPGDFRKIDVPEPVDFVFASLTMMLVIPMLDEFAIKIGEVLKPGGEFLSMDSNYYCPVSIYRHLTEKNANPVKLFTPHGYASTFRRHGFVVEKLLPFAGPYPSATGNWLAGTTFWMRARKR